MSGIRSLFRGPGPKGYASANSAPIRIDNTTNTLKAIVAGSGTTEVEVLSTTPAPISLTANTTLSAALHAVRPIMVNAAAGLTLTLPAATGSGARFRIFIGTLITSNNLIVQVGNANDFMRGFAYTKSDDSASSSVTWATANTGTLATESDTITWNRTTTGTAVVGDYLEIEDIAANVWAVATENNASGTEATPFSAAV